MAARPPTRDDDDTDSIEFGIAAVDAVLRESELAFPASKETVEAALGDRAVPYDVHGDGIELSRILAEVDQSSFESRQQLMNALHPVFEEYRRERGNSVVKQVRSLLPF